MAQFTFNKRPEGTIEVFQDGKKIATGSEKFARTNYGYTGDLTLPTQPTQPTQTLPDTGQPSNNLLTFRDTLSKVTDLARNKRNASFLKFAMPFRGTVSASDFSSILGNLNRASEKFTSNVLERSIPEKRENTFTQRFVGNDLIEFELDPQGKVIGQETITSKGGGQVDIPEFDQFVDDFIQTPEGQQLISQVEQERGQSLLPEERKSSVKDMLKDIYSEAVRQAAGVEEFSSTEKKKLEQAGLIGATRQEQLDFLFQKQSGVGEIDCTLPENEFNFACL